MGHHLVHSWFSMAVWHQLEEPFYQGRLVPDVWNRQERMGASKGQSLLPSYVYTATKPPNGYSTTCTTVD